MEEKKNKNMKKEIVTIGVLISMLFLIGCSAPQQPSPEVKCDAPYKVISGKCCLDQNTNNVCDDQEQQLPKKEVCTTAGDCKLDTCMGCINKAWLASNPPDRAYCVREQFPEEQYECKCVNNACTEVQKIQTTKINAGSSIRFGEEKLPISVEMQKDTRILFITSEGEEVYTLNQVQDAQITLFYGKESFTIKKGMNKIIGPLNVVYSGVNPPKSGNYAVLKIEKTE